MRLLRGPFFLVACLLAIAVGVGFGSGWFRRAATNIEQSPTTLGLGAPPGPLRMTVEEDSQHRARVAAAFEGKVPEHEQLLFFGDFDFEGFCHRLNGPERCQVDYATAFLRALLAESDPKTEDFFLVKYRPEGKPHAESVRAAFLLGKDGRAKIIVETPGDVRELSALILAGGAKEGTRIAFRLLDKSTRIDKRDSPWVTRSFAVFIADDPGELKRLPNGCLASLAFEDMGAPGQPSGAKALGAVTITPTLEPRHKFFAVIAGKAYDGTLGKSPGQEPFQLKALPWVTARAAAEQVANLVKDTVRRAVPGAGRVIVSDSWAKGAAGEIYAADADGERYLVYSSAEAGSLRFGICRSGTVTPLEASGRGSHVVLAFPLKATLRGDEQLLVHRAGTAEGPVAAFADFGGLFGGLLSAGFGHERR
jgi:hypothetical protein